MTCGGIATSRIPASDFGRRDRVRAALGPHRAAPDADHLVAQVDVTAAQLDRSRRTATRTSDASVTISRSRSGIAAVSSPSSATRRGPDLVDALRPPSADDAARVGVDQLLGDALAKIVRSSE